MLIDILTDQLGGTVTYDVRGGTRVSVTFPVREKEAVSDE
jgi:two-component sensor histidine kinase